MTRSWLVRGSLLGLVLALAIPAVAFADAQTLDSAIAGKLKDSVAINSIWVIVAGALVMFMQAGFAFLEIGFSRGKNAGTVIAKILTNFSIAAVMYWAIGFRLRVRQRPADRARGLLPRQLRRSAQDLRGDGPVRRDDRVEVVLPVRLLRRVARDRVGHDARADQVRRLHHLRDRVRRLHLPGRLALGVRRRLAAGQRRHAGLRRLDGRPPDRRHRRPCRPAAARAAARQVRRRRDATRDPGAQHAAVRPGRADPVARLVRVQPGLDAQRARRPLSRRSCWSPSSRPPPAC